MLVQFKIVGNLYNNQVLACEDYPDDGFDLEMVINTFEKYIDSINDEGFEIDKSILKDSEKIKFITSAEPMKELKKKYIMRINDEGVQVNNVFIVIKDEELAKIINKVLELNSVYDIQVKKKEEKEDVKIKLDDKLEEVEHVLDEEQINQLNDEKLKIFQNKNFINLIEIWRNEPELFNTFYQYISNGSIENNFDVNANLEKFDYEKELKYFEKFNFEINHVKTALSHFKGHINLTLRYLLLFKENKQG